jgi:membrane protease YdiL (CAAX protease family)
MQSPSHSSSGGEEMTISNQVRAAEDASLLLIEPSGIRSRSTLSLKPIFVGPNGLRAGWRLLIFVALVAALLAGFVLIGNGGLQGFREAQKHAGQITVTPLLMGGSDAIAFVLLCVATLIMGKLEHRRFGEYGLPWRRALEKDFWVGSLMGFLAISGTLLTMFLLHGFRVTGRALHGTAILSSLMGWGTAFLLAGLFEEFLCRGYLQYTLASGIGFWPAALVMSGLFGFGHAFNPGENAMGAVSAGLFGILLCWFLRRSGNLWCAVGFHAAWDWGQTFYGVPDSGMLPYHSVLSSAFQGPVWLTGGTVGPEASVLTPIGLLVVALVFGHHYREDRYPIEKAQAVQCGRG